MAGAKAKYVSSLLYPDSQLTAPDRTFIIRLISTAQTGFFYTTQRPRQTKRLSFVKYDPIGASVPCRVGYPSERMTDVLRSEATLSLRGVA
jgi:ribosomal protein L33